MKIHLISDLLRGTLVKKRSFVVMSVLVMIGLNAIAGPTDWEVAAGHVKVVEGSYMPTSITFQIDQNAGSASQCAAGNWLEYVSSNADNVKAVYALLLSSKLVGQTVTLFGSNTPDGSGFCQVTHVWAN